MSNEFTSQNHVELLRLYDQGQALAALRFGEERVGPITSWRGTKARLIGGRIAANLGAPRFAQFLQAAAYRTARRQPEANLTYTRILAGRRGPVAAIEFLQAQRPHLEAGTPTDRAEALAAEATLLAGLRDFEAAHDLQSRAEAIDPNSAWLRVERAQILMVEDRYDEALEAANEALEIWPWYRPAIQAVGHLLTLRERDDEALALMMEANQRIDSYLIAHPLVQQLIEAGRFDDAEATLERLIEVTPLQKLEPYTYDSAASLGAQIAAGRGDRAATVAYLRRANAGPVSRRLAERIEKAAPDARRAELPVPFVRQHHVTCAPATLTAISRFWNRPAEHLDIVEEICYDGTSAYSERRWVEDNGWTAREFTLDWDSAVALIDRGVPFTLATRATGMGHLQAVAGYDAVRQTLLLRDPYYRHLREALMPEMAEQQRAGGPRALAMVPTESAHLLDGLTLPESEAYDRTYALQAALQRHDRATAWSQYEALANTPGMADHRLTIEARATIAAYDSDRTEQLACMERLVALFPEDGNWQLLRLALLRDLAPRDRRLGALETLCAPLLARAHGARLTKETPIDEDDVEGEVADDSANTRATPHPIYLLQLAGELSADARQQARTLALLGRVRRFNPIDPAALSLEAQVLWEQRRFDEAMPRYRWAYTLAGQDERHAQSYFQAAQSQGRTEEALALFRSRFERQGKRSADPALSLFQALHQIDRTSEAFDILDRALAMRPDDAALALFAAERNAEFGRFDRAHALRDGARALVSRSQALGASARIARREGKPTEALSLWREIVAAEPLQIEAHNEIAQLISETEGDEALNRHFAAFTERFPHHFRLHQIWAGAIRQSEIGDVRRTVLDRLIVLNPADAWARRESSLDYCGRRMFREALDEIKTAYTIEPTESLVFDIRGHICASSARYDEARTSYRGAIHLSADNGHAISELVRLCDTPSQRREALQYVEDALATQTTSGDGLLTYGDLAARHLLAEETVTTLHRLLTRRPDIWQGWSALIQQLIVAHRLDDALQYATHAIARFPLRLQLYLDAAGVQESRNDIEAERAALGKALELDPYDSNAIHALCASYERTGEAIRARDLLFQAALREPLDAANRFHYARLLYQTGSPDLALNELKVAARLQPQMISLWTTMLEWHEEQGKPRDEIIALAREVLARRPSEARLHYTLAFVMPEEAEARAERLKLLERAIHLNSRLFEAYTLRAEILARSGDVAGAVASCRTPGGGKIPTALQLLAARIEAAFGGDPKAGIAKLMAVMHAEPEFFDGWMQIASWHRDSGPLSASAFRKAAEKLTQLRPQDVRSWGYYGQALQWSNDDPAAIRAYQKAVDIEPRYTFACSELLFLLLKAGRHAETQPVIQAMDRTRSPWAHVYAFQVNRQTKNLPDAADRVCRLCESFDDDTEKCLNVVGNQVVYTDGLPALVAQRLGERVHAKARLNPVAGRIFAWAGYASGNRELCENWVTYLQSQGEIGQYATAALLESHSEAGDTRAIQTMLRERSAYLRESNVGWAGVAQAMQKLGDYNGVVAWTADWRERRKITSLALIPRAVALRELGRRPEAFEVARYSLTLPDERNAHDRHRIWLAVESYIAGNAADGAAYLGRLSGEGDLPDNYRFLFMLAQGMARVADAPPMQRGAAFGAAKELVVQAKATLPNARNIPVLSAVYTQVVRRIAGDVGGPGPQSWALLAGRL